MYRKSLNGAARTGRSAGTIRAAAASESPLPVHGRPEVPSAVSAMDWADHAACLREDPELFFPNGNSGPALIQIEEVKAVCNRCPVVDACLRFALENGMTAGVWGGLTEDERRALTRSTVRPAMSLKTPLCG
jgi:WhiB family transcriptional regulator, redox-sensing transcriptional regulator